MKQAASKRSTMTANTTKAVAVPTQELSDDDITALLRQGGAIAPPSQVNRIKIEGSNFIVGEQIFVYNTATKKPAFIARIVEPMEELQQFWFLPEHAQYAGRPDIQDRMCKSYFNIPGQERKHAEDGTDCSTCPFGPFVKDPPYGKKCQWRGDLRLQIIPDSGILNGDEEIWTLNFPTTSVIEFKGTAKNPQVGSVSPTNFMHKLGKLAQKNAQAAGEDPQTAVMKALKSYYNGGVVAEFRLLPMSNRDGNNTWRVISLEPIQIVDVEETPALESGVAEDPNADLPF